MTRSFVLAGALLAPVSALAQDLPTTPYLPLAMAQTAAHAALEACAADGHTVSVAVVDRSGATKVLLKADNSGPHTVGSSIGKAFSAASLGRDTAGLAGFIGENPANDGLRDMDSRRVIQGGGLPVKFGGALVAGIGVGGAPSGDVEFTWPMA